MKKSIAILLTLALLCTGITAFAETNVGTGSYSKDVKALYQASGTPTTVYSVDITWGNMVFTYQAKAKVWDPESHTYKEEAGQWSAASGANVITVTNHSNAGIKAAFSFTAASGFSGVSGSFTKQTITLGTAEDKGINDVKDSTALSLSGKVDSFTDNTKIGSVTVTISANN